MEERVEDECDVIPVTRSRTKTGKRSRKCENSEKMLSRCVVGGCSNTPSLEEGVAPSFDSICGMIPSHKNGEGENKYG